MGGTLFILTLVSLAAAASFAAIAWRLALLEHRRSDARVAALASAIDSEELAMPAEPNGRPVAVASLFAMAPGAAVKGRPLVKAGVIGTLGTALVIVAAMAAGSHRDTPVVAQGAAPLELVSMRHTRDQNALTVAGFVRNPPTGTPLNQVAAVVFAFDRSGTFLASGKAALDFTVLDPGDESPFVVAVPIGIHADVARYRVSFLTETGTLRQVDRRGQTGFDAPVQRSADTSGHRSGTLN